MSYIDLDENERALFISLQEQGLRSKAVCDERRGTTEKLARYLARNLMPTERDVIGKAWTWNVLPK